MIPEVEAKAKDKVKERPIKPGGWNKWTYRHKNSDTIRTGLRKEDPDTGSLHFKDLGNALDGFLTRSRFWWGGKDLKNVEEADKVSRILATDSKGNIDKTKQGYLYEKLMSEKRASRRNAERLDKDEVVAGTPRLEHFLKRAVEAYGERLNYNITEFLSRGGTLPYEHIQLEYNIMKGFVPLEAMVESTAPEEIEKLRLITDPATNKQGVEAAYIRLDKILHLTQETLARKAAEIEKGGKQNYGLDMQTGTVRVILYQAMAPLAEKVNFQKAKYRLIEDCLFNFAAQGLEYQEILNQEEVDRKRNLERADVQNKVKEIEEMFTITKGGNENTDNNTEEVSLKVSKQEEEAKG